MGHSRAAVNHALVTPVSIGDCYEGPDGSQHSSTAHTRAREQGGFGFVACRFADDDVETGQWKVIETEECDKLTGCGKTPQVVGRVYALGFICDDLQLPKRRSGAGTDIDPFTAGHEQQFDSWRVPKCGKTRNTPIEPKRIWIANGHNDRQNR